MTISTSTPTPRPASTPQPLPPTKEMLRTHSLASLTISNHKSDQEIFDQSELDLLRAWVCDNTPQNRKAVLEARGMLDDPGVELGTKASTKHGSLAGYVCARYGVVGDVGTLNDDEVAMLKEWFESGGGQ